MASSASTFEGRQPWEVGHAPRSLRIRLQSYVAAMQRATGGWDGGSLTWRREELRRLAEATGQVEQLERILESLRAGYVPPTRPPSPDPPAA